MHLVWFTLWVCLSLLCLGGRKRKLPDRNDPRYDAERNALSNFFRAANPAVPAPQPPQPHANDPPRPPDHLNALLEDDRLEEADEALNQAEELLANNIRVSEWFPARPTSSSWKRRPGWRWIKWPHSTTTETTSCECATSSRQVGATRPVSRLFEKWSLDLLKLAKKLAHVIWKNTNRSELSPALRRQVAEGYKMMFVWSFINNDWLK